MRDECTDSGAQLVLAFLAGGVVGAAVALLTAPRSGSEIRGTLRGWARDAQGTAVRVPDALRAAYHEASEAGRRAFNEALRKSGEASES